LIFSRISLDWILSDEFQTHSYMSIELNGICFQKQWYFIGRICRFRQLLHVSNIFWIEKWSKHPYFFILLSLSNNWFIFFSSVCHQHHKWSVDLHLPYRASKYLILRYYFCLLTKEMEKRKKFCYSLQFWWDVCHHITMIGNFHMHEYCTRLKSLKMWENFLDDIIFAFFHPSRLNKNG
jgi:hypothetical protein